MNPAKIHPTLQEELALTSRGLDDPAPLALEPEMPVIVRFAATRGLDAGTLAVGGSGTPMRVERRIDMLGAVAGSATRAEIAAMSESPLVEMIWYDEPVYALLDSSVPLLAIPSLWQSGLEGQGVRLCIVDTGLADEHPDFAGRIAAQQDFTGEGNGDSNGHGTHVASIAAGSGAASNGRFRGVAPQATLLIAKVLRADGTGRMSFVMAGVEWALERGAQIINLSLGSRGSSDGTDATSATVDAAVEAGAVVIVAAGNEGPGSHTIGAPGAARLAITIGAASDEGMVADFSSRGPTADGRAKPDVVLPGVQVIAARAPGTSLGTPVDERYTTLRGTSMATPHGAGVAALMLQANPALRPADVKRLFMEATRSLGVDELMQGKGMLLPTRALELARGDAPAPLPTPTPLPGPTPTPAPDAEGCFAPVARLFRR